MDGQGLVGRLVSFHLISTTANGAARLTDSWIERVNQSQNMALMQLWAWEQLGLHILTLILFSPRFALQ